MYYTDVLYRQVNNKPHVQIKPTKDHAKSYAAYRDMTLKKLLYLFIGVEIVK